MILFPAGTPIRGDEITIIDPFVLDWNVDGYL